MQLTYNQYQIRYRIDYMNDGQLIYPLHSTKYPALVNTESKEVLHFLYGILVLPNAWTEWCKTHGEVTDSDLMYTVLRYKPYKQKVNGIGYGCSFVTLFDDSVIVRHLNHAYLGERSISIPSRDNLYADLYTIDENRFKFSQ